MSNGPYRFLRHSKYTCYMLGQIGYLLGTLSLYNVSIIAVAVGGQLVRIAAEERMLPGDEPIVPTCRQVSYRLIPASTEQTESRGFGSCNFIAWDNDCVSTGAVRAAHRCPGADRSTIEPRSTSI